MEDAKDDDESMDDSNDDDELVGDDDNSAADSTDEDEESDGGIQESGEDNEPWTWKHVAEVFESGTLLIKWEVIPFF